MYKPFALIIFSLILIVCCEPAKAQQKGIIKGKVVDAQSGETLIGANVIVIGTGKGASTDLDGNYQIKIKPGTYDLLIRYISYADKKITEVEVKEGEVKQVDVTMQSATQELQEVVIEEKMNRNTEVAMLTLQKNSIAVQDGISTEQISELGVSNSAQAMKQVTGASIENGKYVVVRGLGDRYSLTMMNGVILPSTEPYRNSTSMDLIPAGMIENIVTVKTFTPDQPGSFSGAVVDVSTKTLPEQFYLTTSVSGGYNTVSSFRNDQPQDAAEGSLDFLGYDDGTRALPNELKPFEKGARIFSRVEAQVPESESAENMNRTSKAFNSKFSPVLGNSFTDWGLSLETGNRDTLFGKTVGFNLGFNYSQSYGRKADYGFTTYQYLQAGGMDEIFDLSGNEGSFSPRLGGLMSFGMKLNQRNELSVDFMYNHKTTSSATLLEGSFPNQVSGTHTYYLEETSHIEQELSSLMVRGEHLLNTQKGTRIKWSLGNTWSSQYEPDLRAIPYISRTVNNQLDYEINSSELTLPFRSYRDLSDVQPFAKVDYDLPISALGASEDKTSASEDKTSASDSKNKLKFGASARHKSRDFAESRFQINPAVTAQTDLDEYVTFDEAQGNLPIFFEPSNAGILGVGDDGFNDIGNFYTNFTLDNNRYEGTELIAGAYVMGIYSVSPLLRVVGGVRAEYTDISVTSGSGAEGSINQVNLLPSLGLTYALNEKTNLRFNASRTLARPNMRELSPFASFDLGGSRIIQGNPNLDITNVTNLDLRYEFFPTPGEVFAVSAFYKYFNQPIQTLLDPIASGSQLNFVNSPDANLFGGEIEYRKNISALSTEDRIVNFGGNLSVVYSRVEKTDEEIENNSINPNLPNWRPFQAQSPFIVNVRLGYEQKEIKLASTLFANAYGRRLTAQGFDGTPDIYEIRGRRGSDIPVPELNWNISKGFGEHFRVKIKTSNLLNARYVTNQELNGEFFTNDFYEIGRTFSVGITYSY